MGNKNSCPTELKRRPNQEQYERTRHVLATLSISNPSLVNQSEIESTKVAAAAKAKRDQKVGVSKHDRGTEKFKLDTLGSTTSEKPKVHLYFIFYV